MWIRKLYDRVLSWAEHPKAATVLGSMSFAEATFFPIPPDVMLVPMVLARPERGWRFAGICSLLSVMGGAVGYLMGYYLFDFIEPLIQSAGYTEAFSSAQQYFLDWGVWIILIAGFSPIPFKIFTITSGVVAMSFPIFLLGSVISRSLRFFLVAGLIIYGGEKLAVGIRKHVDTVGWVFVVLVAAIMIFVSLR